MAFAVLAALRPLRRRLLGPVRRSSALLLAALVGGALFTVRHVDGWAPGWRPLSWQYAHWEPRISRALRALIDFDDDGYSPIAWGGDCDDFDASRNPAAHDHDGIDANCNGTVKPLHPSDEDRGLLPPAGESRRAGRAPSIWCVLITIDCMRVDTLTPEVAPRLVALSRRGSRSPASIRRHRHQVKSLPLLIRGSDKAPTVGERLARRGVPRTPCSRRSIRDLEPLVLPGFQLRPAPTEKELRWTAT